MPREPVRNGSAPREPSGPGSTPQAPGRNGSAPNGPNTAPTRTHEPGPDPFDAAGVPARRLAVVPLGSGTALDATVVGAKAANLARAAVRGLPVLPGFVIVAADRVPGAEGLGDVGLGALRDAWREVDGGEGVPLVVRSSSVHEDGEESSMAGRFESVLDVRGWAAFCQAVARVLDPALDPALTSALDGPAPGTDPLDGMSVLVQPRVLVSCGGGWARLAVSARAKRGGFRPAGRGDVSGRGAARTAAGCPGGCGGAGWR